MMPPQQVEREAPRSAAKIIKRLLGYFKKSRALILWMLGLLTASTLLNLLIPDLISRAIDTLDLSQGRLSVDWDHLYLILAILLAVFVFSSLFSYLQGRLAAKLTRTTTLDIRKNVSEKLIRLPIGFFDTHRGGDMTARLKQSTILTKKHICETHILPFFGKKPINEIKASDVRRWQNQLMNSPKGYSKTYLKTINNQLTCMINYAKRFYDLNTNPCGQAGSIGQAKAEEMDYWTYDEYVAFREGIKDKPLSYICFQVLYWTGIREGELLALTAADIDLIAKQIDINKTYQRLHGEDIITTPKTRKVREKFPFRISCVRNCKSTWIPAICLLRTRGSFPSQNLFSLTRWKEAVRKPV